MANPLILSLPFTIINLIINPVRGFQTWLFIGYNCLLEEKDWWDWKKGLHHRRNRKQLLAVFLTLFGEYKYMNEQIKIKYLNLALTPVKIWETVMKLRALSLSLSFLT